MNLLDSKVHFIGIGGIGMCGIAEVLKNMGCRVTGSDLSNNAQVERLKSLGVAVHIGHRSENIPQNCDVVVFSTAVGPDNVELQEARRRHIPLIQRAEMLSQLMRLKRGIAIAGSHGKTTTTSMVASMMLANQMDPTIVVGGRLDLIKSTAALGKGEWLLAEADESDGSFLRLYPEIAVVTNIDDDHLDYFGSVKNLHKAFADFSNLIPFYGRAIFCGDDVTLSKISLDFKKRQITYGLDPKNDLGASYILNVHEDPSLGEFFQKFLVSLKGKPIAEVKLRVPGRHNVLNALAAFAVGLELKLEVDQIVQGLASYRGVDRRLQLKGFCNGAPVIDDYGHHPTEVDATLEALQSFYPDKKLVVLFQPHRYTRTQSCWNQFLNCFHRAAVVGILDVYPAGEKPIANINSERLCREMNGVYLPSKDLALEFLKSYGGPDRVLVTLGAGDVWKLSEQAVTS